MDRCLETYRGMQATQIASLPPSAPVPFEAAHAIALLEQGRVSDAMTMAVRLLAVEQAPPDPMRGALLEKLRENPFIEMCRSRPMGYAGDPEMLDLALGEARVCGVTRCGRDMFNWMVHRSAYFRAVRRRSAYLAEQIDAAAGDHANSSVVGLFPGYGRELLASRACQSGQVSARLIAHDGRVLGFARTLHRSDRVSLQTASLASVLGGAVRMFDSSLVYAPDLADHLGDDMLAQLLEETVSWLRPGGELVLPALAASPEHDFLEIAADWRPNSWTAADLMRLVRHLGRVASWLRHDAANGIFFLHMQRC
jgi:hypothetical protein